VLGVGGAGSVCVWCTGSTFLRYCSSVWETLNVCVCLRMKQYVRA